MTHPHTSPEDLGMNFPERLSTETFRLCLRRVRYESILQVRTSPDGLIPEGRPRRCGKRKVRSFEPSPQTATHQRTGVR